jgi:hypothetical protein
MLLVCVSGGDLWEQMTHHMMMWCKRFFWFPESGISDQLPDFSAPLFDAYIHKTTHPLDILPDFSTNMPKHSTVVACTFYPMNINRCTSLRLMECRYLIPLKHWMRISLIHSRGQHLGHRQSRVKVGIQFDSSTQRSPTMHITIFLFLLGSWVRTRTTVSTRVWSYMFLHTRSTAKSFLTTVSLVSRRERSLAGAVYIDKIMSVPVRMPQNAKPPPPFIHLSSSSSTTLMS